MKRYIAAAIVASFAVSATSVSATEGALEISSACATSGCFNGDAPGLPITITTPGNYVFTSNLTLPDGDTTGIRVSSSDVVIDMKGFAIVGPNLCSGAQDDCTASGSGNGITSTNPDIRNVTVRNGRIRGTGQYGIILREQAIIDNVVALHNGRSGIFVRTGSTVSNSFANFNSFFGFEAERARLTDCSASDNGQTGFAVSESIVTRAVATKSGSLAGLQDWYGSQVHDSLFQGNQIGIESINGATSVYNSTLNENASVGIFARGDTQKDPSGLPVLLSGNTITNNNGGNGNAQLGGAGAYVELSTNFCGSNTTCP